MDPNTPQQPIPVNPAVQQPQAPEQKGPFWRNKWLWIGLGVGSLLIILTGGAYLLGKNLSENKSEVATPSIAPSTSPTSTITVSKVSEHNKEFENEELGFSITYPESWGSVSESQFDSPSIGNVDYFVFSNFDDLIMGGLEKDYSHPGRGGSLIDYGGFIKNGENLSLVSYKDKSILGKADGYKITNSGNCIYTTSFNYYESQAYHAVCNLNNDETFGWNFAVHETSKLSTSDFIKIVESFSLL